jgi:hypothetical protein
VHGKSIVYPRGTQVVACVDDDAAIDLPAAPPPQLD